jgi:hypothetical protein
VFITGRSRRFVACRSVGVEHRLLLPENACAEVPQRRRPMLAVGPLPRRNSLPRQAGDKPRSLPGTRLAARQLHHRERVAGRGGPPAQVPEHLREQALAELARAGLGPGARLREQPAAELARPAARLGAGLREQAAAEPVQVGVEPGVALQGPVELEGPAAQLETLHLALALEAGAEAEGEEEEEVGPHHRPGLLLPTCDLARHPNVASGSPAGDCIPVGTDAG